MQGLQFNIWAVLILLGATHGVFLAIVLWFKKQNQGSNRIFALLIGSIVFHLFEYAMSISGLIVKLPHLIFSSYPLLFVISPLFYLYILHFLNGDLALSWKKWLHFVPAALILLLFLPFYLQAGVDKVSFLLEVGSGGFEQVPVEQFLIMGAQVIQLFIYLVISYRLIIQRYHLYEMRRANQAKKFRWLKHTTLALLGFTVLYAVFLALLIFNKNYRVETDYVIVLSLSSLLFAAGYVALAQPEIFTEGLNGNDRKSLLSEDKSQSVRSRLENWMQHEKPYLSEDLKISDVADALDVPVHHLSEVINQAYQTNFFDFVNHYRIEEAKRLLTHPIHRDQKILAIAFDTGFSNKGTFNRVFKKFTGQTPSAYRQTNTP